MDIRRVAIDAVNEIIVMQVTHMDYKGQVQKRINERMATATIKGFRKGQVPRSLVEKFYGQAIKMEEVNNVIQLALNRFIESEKLEMLGSPLPKMNDNFSWNDEDMTFEFEIGLAPNFEINLDAKGDIIKYIVKADNKLIDDQVTRIQKQFGTTVPQEVVEELSDVSGTFTNEEKGINAKATFALSIFKDKKTQASFIGKKVGDVVTLKTKGLFEDDHMLMDYLKVSHDDVHSLDIEVNFMIEAINGSELAELNQELFDRIFGEGKIASVDELKAKIKEDAESQFALQADQKLMSDVTNYLIENTKFDLPSEFLIKWLQNAGEKQLTAEEAKIEYEKSEKGLRYQLIEGKAMAQNNVQISFDDLKDYTAKVIRAQMAQYGQLNPTDEEVEGIVARVLSNQDEARRLSQQVVSEKILEIFKEKTNAPTKEVTYQQFIAASYGE